MLREIFRKFQHYVQKIETQTKKWFSYKKKQKNPCKYILQT